MKRVIKKAISIILVYVLTVSSMSNGVFLKADDAISSLGSLSTEVTGTWSYWDGNKDVVQTNAMLLDKLPTIENKGVTRWTTDNYDATTGAIDIGEWGTSLMWSYTADKWGNSTYALPMSYKATANGFYVTKPSTIKIETSYLMSHPEDGSLTDFIVGPSFTAGSKKVDKVTDWTYDVVFENASDPSVYVKATIAQGSPFSYYQAVGTRQMKIMRQRSLPSSIIYFNCEEVEDSTMLVFEVYDNTDDAFSNYSNYDYYAVYVPEGTTWTKSAGTGYGEDYIGTLTANFPSEDKSYMSFAWLCETKGKNGETAKEIAELYKEYAYNFITDTEASYEYDYATSTLTTTYQYTLDRKEESIKDGTIMGILPHQYKNMEGYSYLDNTAKTIRGIMKYIAGSSYKTTLTYTGILPNMMSIHEADYPTLQSYVQDFMDEYGPTATEVTKENYSVNTYDTGKKLNRAVQVMAAAEACNDTESAEALLAGIKAELIDWFTYSGKSDDKYFYYDEGVGSLFGFPQAYYTVDGMTDHHFHYGYFINAAAQVAFIDPSFATKYGNVIDELIGDIATAKENSPDSRYPQYRYFCQYEGHSWASGHANFGDGNNQESSSEALNAWAGLILYGQATNNDELTERGIYLYTTEVSSVNSYWFDIDGDILDPDFKKMEGGNPPKHSQASMVWGGKYDYATWWTAEPLQVQGINILPMTAASFYAARDKDYILLNYETAQINEAGYTGEDKDVNRWNEIWSVYLAMADPEKALEHFDPYCSPEAGDSKAHAYHMIMAFEKYGTPDLSVTGDNPLSAAFINSDGEKTYVAYNAGNEQITVTFSDGTTVVANSGELATLSEAETEGKAGYKVEHYIQLADGTYILNLVENKSSKIGEEVQAVSKEYTGFELDKTVEGSSLSGIVDENGELVLRLYYSIVGVKAPAVGADPSLYVKFGSYNGLDISYYLIQNDFDAAIKLLDNNMTFYLEYNGGKYTALNTYGFLDNVETPNNVFNGVYKFNTSILQKDSYTTLKVKSGNDYIKMIIKYGNPVDGPVIEDAEITIPTGDPNQPTDIESLVLGTTSDNTLLVTFVETEEQKIKGQKYNVYVNDIKVLSEIGAGTHVINGVSAGKCVVKVTALLAGNESGGITDSIRVAGKKSEEETSTEEETTPEVTEEITTFKDVTLDETTDSVTTVAKEEMTTDIAQHPTSGNEITVPVTTMQKTTEKQTTKQPAKPAAKKITVKKTKIKLAKKKKVSKKITINLKKVKGATGYRIAIYKKNKIGNPIFRKYYKRNKLTISRKRFKNQKKLYIRVRAYKLVNGKKYFGKWTDMKRIKITK